MNTIYWQVGLMIGVMTGVAAALIKLFEWGFSHSPSPPCRETSNGASRRSARLI